MKLIEYYIKLFIHFAKGVPDQPIKSSRTAVGEVIQCSERNVIHVLNKMEERQWIKRTKGHGRGNITLIHFLKSLEEMFKFYEENAPTYKDIEKLVSLLEESSILTGKKQLFDSLLTNLFGLKMSVQPSEKEEYDSLRIPYFRSILSLDPSQIERQTERHLVGQLFTTLVTYNKDENIVKPAISHHWERSKDGKVWTFYLRKGVRFHNERLLEAEDVQFTFDRLRETPSRWIVRHLEKITCIGKHVVQFHFTIPNLCWDTLLCSPKCSVIPFKYGGKSPEEFSKHPIGTGPYKIKEHHDQFLSLAVHQSFFQERAHIDEIEIFVLPTIQKYLHVNKTDQGSIFYIPFTTEVETPSPLHDIDRKHLSVKYLMWNVSKENIKSKPKLRKRVAEILNRKRMVDELGYPRYVATNSFIVMEEPSFLDVGQAYTSHEPLTLLTYDLTPHKEDIQWIQSECKAHGIRIEINTVPYVDFSREMKHADLVLSEYVIQEVSENALFNLFQSETSVIRILSDQGRKARQDDLFEEALQSEKENQLEVLKQIEQDLIDHDIVLPLYSTYQRALHHEKLLGLSLNTLGLVPFKNLFYRKD
ncbi:ABC transporter substrate-binding protein [Fredinandcohnia humi]